jgi:hypothetical protein
MTMSPRSRKLALTVHVASSVGWIGAVVTFIGISAIGLTGDDATTVRGAYLVMEPAARFVLVPLAVLSLLTGVIQSLGTAWGLFQHYWVVFKLAITVFATAVLLLYLRTFAAMAEAAADSTVELAGVRNSSPLLHAVLALVLLLFALVLAVYKPRGLTRSGLRRGGARSQGRPKSTVPG